MATYYHANSEIQSGGAGDGLQTLILMNPSGYVAYPDAQQPQPPGSFFFLNPATSSTPGNPLNHVGISHAPTSQPTQQLVGIPLQQAPSAGDPHQDISALQGFLHRVPYNMYSPVDLTAAREVTRSQQGLSLTLSSSQQQRTPGYGPFRLEREGGRAVTVSPTGADEGRVSGGISPSASGISNNGMQGMLLNSKYLRAAQELLDEVVNVGNGAVKTEEPKNKAAKGQSRVAGDSPRIPPAEAGEGQNVGERSEKRGSDLTTAERQEIQMKKSKLVNMLDEVEQRYRQYHHQMQIVITWFEQVAVIGAARTYTALALQTISKQFRCLKDAILGQIRAANKSLGEEETGGGKAEGSKLKFVDNQLRQQRALQQLGMIQHNAWRPQRGLPERAVSVLRAWLFEHFLHPYPKDSDKIMLAKQTGLTRSQVSNWFINARVRLWKPMVEEMYMEEMKDQEHNGGSDDKTTGKVEQSDDAKRESSDAAVEESPSSDTGNIKLKQDGVKSQYAADQTGPVQNPPGFNLMGGAPAIDSNARGSPKKSRVNEMLLHSPTSVHSVYMDAKPIDANGGKHDPMGFGGEPEQRRDGFTLLGGPTNFMGGFGSYPIGTRLGVEQFPPAYSGGGVSLTLGLPHCENISISATHHHQSFLPSQSIQLQARGVEVGDGADFSTPVSSHATNVVYENFNIQNRKRLAAQLLPDFVA